jgi:hypothetical protein
MGLDNGGGILMQPVFTDDSTILGDGTVEHPLVASGGGGGIQVARVAITNSQIRNMGSTGNTPVEILPSPGEGKAIIVLQALLEYIFGTTVFTFPGTPPNPAVALGGASNILDSAITIAFSVAASASGFGLGWDTTHANLLALLDGNSEQCLASDLENTLQDFDSGDGSAVMTVWYSTVEV